MNSMQENEKYLHWNKKTKEIIILNDISCVCPNAFPAYRLGVFVPHD